MLVVWRTREVEQSIRSMKSTEEFTLAATHGMSEELIETIRGAHRRLRDNSPVGQSALKRSVIEISDLATDQDTKCATHC